MTMINKNQVKAESGICITLRFLEDNGEFDFALFKQVLLLNGSKEVNVSLSQRAELKEAFLRFVVKQAARREWSNIATISNYTLFKDSEFPKRKVVKCYRTLSFEWLGICITVKSDFKTYDSETGVYGLKSLKQNKTK